MRPILIPPIPKNDETMPPDAPQSTQPAETSTDAESDESETEKAGCNGRMSIAVLPICIAFALIDSARKRG